MTNMFRICLQFIVLLCPSTVVYATSVGTLDGSPTNLPPGLWVENRVSAPPNILLLFLLAAQLGGLTLVGFPLLIYRRIRRKWPQSGALRHRLLVLGGTAIVILTAVAFMHSSGMFRLKDVLFLLTGCVASYAVMQAGDFLVVRRVWQRFRYLPSPLRPVAVFLLPLFMMWLVLAILRASVPQHAYTYQNLTPNVAQNVGPIQPLPSTVQELAPSPPQLTMPSEVQQ